MNSVNLNSSELTTLHTELLNEERYARTLANIARRAETLWEDGYTFSSMGKDGYIVFTPKNETYAVFLSDLPAGELFGSSCSCPAFEKYATCKHLMAVQWKERENAQEAAFDALMSGAETETGCDPYAEF